ncbi:hypothetical protein X474_11000 [Dethiosulfatarculus sandiegensis]|uniref:Uncharacterized protein n=1 Tax=Dethiosulfatarculus sandiegensis TaxID=1429043 RepID=A0A0D2HTJ3_9BACT|nr:hypothetical protein X474_11000 [Dethiosulfatarculus sandiegensis]
MGVLLKLEGLFTGPQCKDLRPYSQEKVTMVKVLTFILVLSMTALAGCVVVPAKHYRGPGVAWPVVISPFYYPGPRVVRPYRRPPAVVIKPGPGRGYWYGRGPGRGYGRGGYGHR